MSTESAREALAGNARAALARARITTTSLASQTGKSRAYWSRRLDGSQPLTADDLVALSDLTSVTVADLVSTTPQTAGAGVTSSTSPAPASPGSAA